MTAEFLVAAHALVLLHHRKQCLTSEEIAENVCTNPARVRKVLSKLKKHGLVTTRNGTEGGYSLHGNPEDITLRDVFLAMDQSFVRQRWKSGDIDRDCQVSSGMAPLMDDLLETVDQVAIDQLEKTTIEDMEKALMRERK